MMSEQRRVNICAVVRWTVEYLYLDMFMLYVSFFWKRKYHASSADIYIQFGNFVLSLCVSRTLPLGGSDGQSTRSCRP
jgi:hypothetical protein